MEYRESRIPNRALTRLTVVFVAVLIAACGGGTSTTPPTTPTPPTAAPISFTLQGDAESTQGATWTYRGTLDGVTFDLQGILLKPRGAGPFSAVVISHGAGGNANGYSLSVAFEMVQWGLVCIATNYTHSGGVAPGAPGTSSDPGASQSNVLRAHAAYEILRTLGYVDMSRVAAHGHSMGAFVTVALAASYPNDFRAASHTAGGVRPDSISIAAAPSESQARNIRAPYQIHHGDADIVVPLLLDQLLVTVLQSRGVTHELHVYPGGDHDDVARSATMFARVRAWYAAHGLGVSR